MKQTKTKQRMEYKKFVQSKPSLFAFERYMIGRVMYPYHLYYLLKANEKAKNS